MKNLKITAHLASSLAAYDDFSPSLDSLLEWLWLDARGLAQPNPDSESLIEAPIPLAKGEVSGEWYWQVSSPVYQIEAEETSRFRKRWDPELFGHINWGKRKARIDTSQGPEKNYDLPLYLRSTSAIAWYAVGDADGVRELLAGCRGIGKKRSQGWGQITRWQVEEIEHDWHLWGPGNQLMRPMPVRLMTQALLQQRIDGSFLLHWGWRPPGWHQANRELCVMPTNNVVKQPQPKLSATAYPSKE